MGLLKTHVHKATMVRSRILSYALVALCLACNSVGTYRTARLQPYAMALRLNAVKEQYDGALHISAYAPGISATTSLEESGKSADQFFHQTIMH